MTEPMISVTTWSRLQMHMSTRQLRAMHLGGRKSILLRLAVGRRTEVVDRPLMDDEVRRVDLGLLPGLRAVRGEGVQQRHLRPDNAELLAVFDRLVTVDVRCWGSQRKPAASRCRPCWRPGPSPLSAR